MLYVFQVDTGTMLTFDMNLAMDSVCRLQEAIGKSCHIPADKQVLLISGGENLDPHARVCSYSSGTDTNPIFLFSKHSIESATPPSASVTYGSEHDLKEQVEGSLNMPATYETVVARAQLALQFSDVAKDELRVCEKLVHDQHLQHQGWAAVIANLEDITSAFKGRSEAFRINFEDYLLSRDKYSDTVSSFPTTVILLSRIPLLPSLVGEEHVEVLLETERQNQSPKTLLDWISAQDSRGSLEQMTQQCQVGLQQFSDAVKESLVGEVTTLLEAINNPSMKEVKGLEDRLYGLEQLMFGARKLVQEQIEMAQGFVQNQNRASNLRDVSVLPDLCSSHKRQLLVMLKNHQSLRDIRRRCTMAKEELSANLHTRLRWVMFVEKSICDVDSKLMIHHETLKKLKRKLEIIHQMADAPYVYASAVVEVVRRKMFTTKFLDWANVLADESLIVHKEELKKREVFSKYLKRHFLQSLFPGFEDKLPAFATSAPKPYDVQLPPITPDDIEYIRAQVPELADKLKVPDEQDVDKKFSSKTLTQGASGTAVAVQAPSPPPALPPHLMPGNVDQAASDIVVLAKDTESPPQEITSNESTGMDDTDSKSHTGVQDTISETKQDNKVPLKGSDDPEFKSIAVKVHIYEDVSQSVEVLEHGEEEEENMLLREEEEDEFLSLQPEIVGQSCPPVQPLSKIAVKQTSREEPSLGVPPAKIEKRDSKSTPETSPDVEDVNSEGFTTADFYIDESMPSSMTESPPTKRVLELQQILLDKNSLLESKERELDGHKKLVENLQPKLAKAEESFRLLHDVAEKGALQLKCDVLSLEKQVQKDRDEFHLYIDSVTKTLVDVICRFEDEQSKVRDSTIESLKLDQEQQLHVCAEKLDLETQRVRDLQSEVCLYQQKVEEISQSYDALKHEMDSKVSELEKQMELEVTDTRNKLMLENEVELEKVRSDYADIIEGKERELTELNECIATKEAALSKLEKEKEQITETLNEQFQKDKDEITKILKKEYEAKKNEIEKQVQETLEKAHNEALEKMRLEHHSELESKTSSLKEELAKQHSDALELLKTELEQKHQKFVEELQEQLASQKEEALQNLREELISEHEASAIDSQPVLVVEAHQHQETDANSYSSMISLEKHSQILTELKAAWEEGKAVAIAEALSSQRTEHETALSEMVQRLEQEKHDSLQNMKSSMTAEKQVVFNEALTKVVAEKDRVIEDLKLMEASLQAERDKDKATIMELLSGRSTEDLERDAAVTVAKEREEQIRTLQKRHQQEIAEIKKRLLELPSGGIPSQAQSTIGLVTLGQSTMGQSVVPVTESVSLTSNATMHEKIQFLESTLRSKDEEMSRLQQKVMQLSMTTSSRSLVQDKVSITSCNVADIVLLCLDERHDHYVVFNMGTTLHFLHSDCLEALGLRTNPGEAKKSWVLAEITDKEYCQAKKAQNRFRVPLGTKFYRVKARPWDREAALRREASARDSSSPGLSGK